MTTLKRLAIVHLGCKVNRTDAAALVSHFDPSRVEIVRADTDADLFVINSCTVTHASGAQSLKAARQIARRFPHRPIVFTGCHATLSPAECEDIDAVVRVVGVDERPQLPRIVAELLGDTSLLAETPRVLLGEVGMVRAPLKVQDGCSRRCSYCIVPLVRGESRSEPLDEVIKQAQALERAGHKEIVLTGVHLGAWGHDLDDGCLQIVDLVESILEATDDVRLRLSSIEPDEVSERLCQLVFENPRMCRHLHLPLQSGCDRILESMGRPYKARDFMSLVSGMLGQDQHLCIGLDVIAGYPGEDDAAFARTCELIECLDVAYLHVFPYSPRPQTAAATMPNQVLQHVCKERTEVLRTLSQVKRDVFYKRQLGLPTNIVVEKALKAGFWRGTSDNYLDVSFVGQAKRGDLVEVIPYSVGTAMLATLATDSQKSTAGAFRERQL